MAADPTENVLENCRSEIDRIDREIVSLLNERYRAVRKIGCWKAAHGLPIRVPEREKALLEKLSALNQGPMTEEILHAVYGEIIRGACSLEETEGKCR